jgi:hypothetical protein
MKNPKSFNSDLRKFRKKELQDLEKYVDQIKHAAKKPEILLYNWPRYVRTHEITRFICFYEIYKLIQNIHGSIFQCGVLEGNTLFSFAHLVENFEFRNYTRKIYAFDTFGKGDYKKITKEDGIYTTPKGGGYVISSYADLKKSVELFNNSKIFNQFKGIELYQGNAAITVPNLLKKNRGIIIAALNLQISSYNVEKKILQAAWPRIPKGGTVHCASLGFEESPGPGQMMDEALGISNIRIKRFSFATKPSVIIKE